MSRSAPAAVARGERLHMGTGNRRSSLGAEDLDEDPSALTENCDYPLPPSEQKSDAKAATAASDKPAQDDEDEVAIPIPIATLVFHDGRTEPVYTPLAGHEHLFKARPMLRPLMPFSSPAPAPRHRIQVTPTCVHDSAPKPSRKSKSDDQPLLPQAKKSATPRQGLLKSKSLKRARSVAQDLASKRKSIVAKERIVEDAANKEATENIKEDVRIVTEESYTFYIGDMPKFKQFLYRRFDELTMKPLRGIVTHWVKLLEPRRLGDWGKYHEMLPSEAETPPWWPQTVIYKEPSHLKKDELSTLAVEMMLVHRDVDKVKRKGPWITKLREVAKFSIQTTSADHFSSSKGTTHSEEMKKRAQEHILPSIFDVAQSYEDHIMQYSLFDGTGNVDPGKGKHHTWKPIPRPARPQPPRRPRRAVRHRPEEVQEALYEASGEETEPDDTMMLMSAQTPQFSQSASSPLVMTPQEPIVMHTPQPVVPSDDGRRMMRKVDGHASVSGPCTPVTPQDDCKMYRTTSTPNSSFDRSLHGLHIEEDLDVKPSARTLSCQSEVQSPFNGLPYGQALQYPPVSSTFNGQAYRPNEDYSNLVPSPFAQGAPSFINPFSIYNAPPPQMGYSQYAAPMPSAHAFPYEQGMFSSPPMRYPSTPVGLPLPDQQPESFARVSGAVTPPDSNMAFNNLPSDYPVGPERLQQF